MNYPYKYEFPINLVNWYNEEKRDLPWRQTKDPYKIWVSEVMLQQTRVETVIPYYNRFLAKYPTLQSLAYAPQEELLKMWEGLGYYSRARNLQAGVREVVEKYDSQVPNNRHDLSKLKGIGPYTAGAILSIAFNKPEHAVDGNVMRVLSRVLHIKEDIAIPKTKKIFEMAVTELIANVDPSAFNQGLMDLGAQICTPTSPKCLLCPVREYCLAFHEGNPEQLPVKTKKIKTKKVKFDVFVVKNKDAQFLLEKRPEEGLLANMWQFPMIEINESETQATIEKLKQKYSFNSVKIIENNCLNFKHVFSHLTWELNCHFVEVEYSENVSNLQCLFSMDEMQDLPMSVPMLKVMHLLK